MGNPFLDEIPDACISEEMQEEIRKEREESQDLEEPCSKV